MTEKLYGLKFVDDQRHGGLRYLEQTKLPGQISWAQTRDFDQICRAIRQLDIRGAPAIGIAGAYAIAMYYSDHWFRHRDHSRMFYDTCKTILETRLTAVNLRNAVQRLENRFEILRKDSKSGTDIADALFAEAQKINAEDVVLCARITEHGSRLLFGNVLTHCNTGAAASCVDRYITEFGVHDDVKPVFDAIASR